MREVYVLSRIPNLIKELRKALPKLSFNEVRTGNEEKLKKAEILIADFDLIGPHLYDYDRIKWIQGTWAGIDFLMPFLKQDVKLPYLLTRYSGQHFGRIMSEYVIGCIVNHERNWNGIVKNQLNCVWSKDGKISEYRTISDLNVGIMGVGNIGRKIANYLHTFGARIYGLGRTETNANECLSGYFATSDIRKFLNLCDYVINVLPNTEGSKGLLNGDMLENCKERGAIFINIGRGTIISEMDLINALNKKWITHAYLDVFVNEPLEEDNMLWKMSNVTITPHVAGMSRPQDFAEQFCDNYQLYLDNKKIPTEVDVNKGY